MNHEIRQTHILSITAWLVAVWFGPLGAQVNAAERRFALIVANNHSPDSTLLPLSFADDDAARFHELTSAAGVTIRLHAVLDSEAQRRFPAAAQAALPPTQKQVEASLVKLFEGIEAANQQGDETHLIFYYSGHGGLGPNQEGRLTLLDGVLSRNWLFHRLLARSPARFNHLLLDACHAYHVVHKRGQQPQYAGEAGTLVESFLKTEELAAYPNTGVLLAKSTSSETHEWGLWEAGIFSHELRSALLGGGDVDGDGRVGYLEAAASVEAANGTVPDPKARLQVHVHPPPLRQDVALLDLAAFQPQGWLSFAAQQADRYHLVDGRGVRVFDLHYTTEQSLRMAVLGQAPFFLIRGETASQVTPGTEVVAVGSLGFSKTAVAARGPVEASFRKHLYEMPFGISYLRGMRQGQQHAQVTLRLEASAPLSKQRKLAISSLVLTAASTVVAGTFYGLAADSHAKYQAAEEPMRIRELRSEAESRMRVAYIMTGVTGVLAVTTLLLWLYDDPPVPSASAEKSQENLRILPQVGPDGMGLTLGGRF